ncbi:hypothetical protein PACILC2_20660 [Paenibacillus cisolokensis]|uniref:Uncharacterized protein n=1 Tax=Paenibacillus cisolokensis TaxID=1658519 RepID=A0ABQ4N5N2_9BACL|nr:hypothetical protein PACILC2_20660 [Paenibacillus cisolokensis]
MQADEYLHFDFIRKLSSLAQIAPVPRAARMPAVVVAQGVIAGPIQHGRNAFAVKKQVNLFGDREIDVFSSTPP